MTKQTQSVQAIAVERAITILLATKCQFKIITPDGVEHGELKLAAPEPERKRNAYLPRGELRNYYRPIVDAMAAGDVVCLHPGPKGFSLEHLRGAVTAYLSAKWGAGSYISTITVGDDPHVEILRLK